MQLNFKLNTVRILRQKVRMEPWLCHGKLEDSGLDHTLWHCLARLPLHFSLVSSGTYNTSLERSEIRV